MDDQTKAKIKALWSQFDALVISQRFPQDVQLLMLTTTREAMFDWSLDFERAIATSRTSNSATRSASISQITQAPQ